MSFFDSGPLPDWGELRKLLGKDLPWNLIEQWDKDDNWLNQYMEKMGLSVEKKADGERAVPSKSAAPRATVGGVGNARIETRKTQDRVYVTIRPPSSYEAGKMRLYATPDRLRISGLPGEGVRSVQLPCLVLPKSGKASWKEGRLVVSFKKRRSREGEVELFIRE